MVYTPRKTNLTMEKQPFEDVSPIKTGDVPCHVSFQGSISTYIYPITINHGCG